MNTGFRRASFFVSLIVCTLLGAVIARADLPGPRQNSGPDKSEPNLSLHETRSLINSDQEPAEKQSSQFSPYSSPPALASDRARLKEVDGHPLNHRLPEDLHCLEPVPEQVGTTLDETGEGHEVLVRVLVLLDYVEESRASQIMNEAAQPYALLKIRMEYTYLPIGLIGRDYVDHFRQVRPMFGGGRPDGFDLVHILTNKDIVTPDGNPGVAGVAYCIGGIRYREAAFSISEANYRGWYKAGGIVLRDLGPVIIVAHEIGHLLGAHHHYGDCLEGNLWARPSSVSASPCTIMDQTLFFSAMYFGHLEGAVIRGHALRYAGHPEYDPIPF